MRATPVILGEEKSSPKKEPLILIRYGAFGDLIYMSAVLPYLFPKYDIYFETNTKGMMLFGNDKRFADVLFYEPWRIPAARREEVVFDHWREIAEKNPGVRVLNFFQAMEQTAIVPEWNPDAVLPIEERRRKYEINFYEQHFRIADIEMPADFIPPYGIVFTDEEERWARDWRYKNRDSFIILVVIGGSTLQKVFPTWLETFCKRLIDRCPKMKMYLLGDVECEGEDWVYKRTFSLIPRRGNKTPSFRQALLMAKYADYVLGAETGLLVGAGMWGTPKTALMTTASVEQFAKYTVNDYSVQSTAPCSPCYRTCYTAMLCEKEMFYGLFPRCTAAWDFELIERYIMDEYALRGYRD